MARVLQKGNQGVDMPSLSYSAGADLETWTKHEWTEGLQIDTLQELDTLSVRTLNNVYEIIVLHPMKAEVLVRGGKFFPEYTPAVLAGSSLGGSFLKLHGIYVGSLPAPDGRWLPPVLPQRGQPAARPDSGLRRYSLSAVPAAALPPPAGR